MNRSVARFYWAKLGTPPRVLDIGCGDCGLGYCRPAGTSLIGVDRCIRWTDAASSYDARLAVDLDRSDLPFASGVFDAVVAKDVLEHVAEPWRTLREAHRILRPHGRIVISVVCERPKRVWADYTHVRGFTRLSASAMLADCGFQVLDLWRMGPLPLTTRLSVISWAPILLKMPPLRGLYTSSYEALAERN